ncbi:MAG: hypothetical protein HWE16_01845 [Gammaproteobacteria bacterium]|nr:hypothetical protein [Gammaproteobacteria bacterium]
MAKTMALFWLTLVLFILVIFIGNYLLFNRVLPKIDETAATMPSAQAKQVDKYLSMLAAEERKGFAYYFLKYFNKIQALMGLLLICNILYFSFF